MVRVKNSFHPFCGIERKLKKIENRWKKIKKENNIEL